MGGGPLSAETPGEVARNEQADAELRTFLIADIRGYTSFTQRHGDELAGKLAGKFAQVTRAVVEDHIGRVLELRGDEALCVFVSPRQAVRCAVALQRRYVEETGRDPVLPLPVGIGMDVGEAVQVEGGYRSGALNLAARLCSIARPGEILATGELTHLTRRLDGMSFVVRDPVRLKGLPEPLRPVRVVPDGENPIAQLVAIGALPPKPVPLVGPEWFPDRARRQPLILAAVPIIVAIVGAAVLVGRTVTATHSLPGFRENVLGTVDLHSGALTHEFDMGNGPSAVALTATAAWVANKDDNTVSRFDLRTHQVTTIDVGDAPAGIAVAGGDVWVANSGSGTLSRIDTTTSQAQTLPVGSGPTSLTFGAGALWVVDTTGDAVYRVDPESGDARLLARVAGSPTSVAVAAGHVWVSAALSGTVEALDPTSGAVLASVPVGSDPRSLVAIGDSVWVTNNLSGTVSRISADTDKPTVTGTVPVGAGPVAVDGTSSAVWVASADSRSLTQIDPAGSPRVVSRITTGSAPEDLAVQGSSLWVAAASNPSLHRGGTLTAAVADTVVGRWEVLSITNDGLLGLRRTEGATGSVVVPDLATDLPTVSQDGRTYTFTLREGVTWSNGRPLTGDDVRRGLERAVAGGGGAASPYGAIIGAAACTASRCDLSAGIGYDARTRLLTIRLTRPDNDFAYKLALPTAVAVPADTPLGQLDGPLPATGPYMIASETDHHVELDRNPHFHEWSTAAQPDGFPDHIVVDAFSGNGHGSAGADWVVGAGGADLSALRDRYGSRLRVSPALSVDYLFLRTTSSPFDDVRARRAVAFALDRSSLAANWYQPGAVTCQVLPPGIPGYEPYCPFTLSSQVPGSWRAANLTRAQHLVTASGTRGDVVRLVAPQLGAFDQIKDTLTNLGYHVRLTQFAGFGKYFGCLSNPSCPVDAGYIGWIDNYPAPADFLQSLLSCDASSAKGGYNFAEFCDPSFDAGMQKAAALQLTNPAAATARWAQLEHEAVDRAPLIGLVTPFDIDIVGTRVGHAERNPQLGAMLDLAWVR